MPPYDIRQGFAQLQSRLLTNLGAGDLTSHPGTKGSNAELNWIRMLADFLPARYAVASAFVVDIRGQRSEQLDVVIYDRQYSPILFDDGSAGLYIPAESVYAVFEVKPELTKAYIEYAGEKVASVRTLIRTSTEIVHAASDTPAAPKDPFQIVGGILTRSSSWAPALGQPFEGALREQSGDRVLDIGCAARDGAFDVVNDTIERSQPEDAVMFFALHLLGRLQALGTVPKIDVMAWAIAGGLTAE